MSRRRLLSIPVLTVLASMTLLAALAMPTPLQHHPVGSTLEPGDVLLAAVQPVHRPYVALQASRMPRYTIVATLLPPSGDAETGPSPEAGTALPATPQASPLASPQASLAVSASFLPTPALSASPISSLHTSSNAFPQATAVSGQEDVTAQAAVGDIKPPLLAEPQIAGTVDLHYVNTTGQPLDALYIRLYPNLQQYGSGRMVIANVHVDGKPVALQAPALHAVPNATPLPMADPGAGDLALVRLPLGDRLAPYETTDVRFDFSTTVPIDPPDENGLFQYLPESGTWTLAHWFPLLAGYHPETGWELDPPAAWSDITFSNTALFDLTLTVPDDLTLVTTGVEVASWKRDGNRVMRITTGPVRDVAMVGAPNLSSSSTEVDGVTVTSWYRSGGEAGAATMLQWGAQALAVFSERFGPYPYTSLEIAPVPDVVGYEFPQLIFIGADFYPDPEGFGSRPGAIEFLVAHEVAHQWWYGLVGSNPHRHAYLDEGLTEYSTILYFEAQYGEEVAGAHLRNGLIHRYAFMLVTGGDQVVDQPTAAFPNLGAYYATVYRKAGLGFEAIRQEIGDDAFFAALRSYADEHRFGVATPSDLRSAFEAAAARDLGELWTRWFESDHGRVEIVMEPLPATPMPAPPVPATPAATPVVSPHASPVLIPVALPLATPVVAPIVTPGASPSASPATSALMASPMAAD